MILESRPLNKSFKQINRMFGANKNKVFTFLFTIYYPFLFSYGYKIFPNEELIKDCIQELFLTLWNRWEILNNVYCVKSYLLCSIRRLVIKQIKNQQKLQSINSSYIEYCNNDIYEFSDLPDYIESKLELINKMTKAINSLSNRQKMAIYLKFYDGLSNREIADIMGINMQSVYNYISKAIRKLKILTKK